MKQKLFVKKTERVAATKHVTAPKKVRPFSFFNLLLTIVLWVALVVFFYGDRLRPPLRLIPGQRAPETIAASVDFKSVNQAATDSKFRQVADEVLPVFYIDNSATENAQWVLTTNQLSGLLPSGSGIDLQRIVLSAISNASARGIISAGDFQTRFNGKAPSGKVALRGNHTDSVRK
ncbi:MAG: hypothetical protein FJ220_07100, partial [Kiritimatiellaceae bacterium]|nr:hypothetical protein [Kiritimatiellaceae bacterium]